MSVIIKGKRPVREGMNPSATSVDPGQAPPWVIPHCRKCRLPVERFTVDWISSPFYLPVQWQCCGRTGGHRIPAEEALFKSKHGGVVWVNTERT